MYDEYKEQIKSEVADMKNTGGRGAGSITAALLLRSANDRHPRGLANGSDVVGRHYMGHTNSVMMAISKCPNPTVFQKTLAVNDFYFASKEWDHPMGHISFVGKLDGITMWTHTDPALSSAIVIFRPGALDPRRLGAALTQKERIVCTVRASQDRPGLRVSPHFYNTMDEMDRTVGAIRKYLASGV